MDMLLAVVFLMVSWVFLMGSWVWEHLTAGVVTNILLVYILFDLRGVLRVLAAGLQAVVERGQ